MLNITVKPYEDKYAEAVSSLIKEVLIEIDAEAYEPELMEEVAAGYSADRIHALAETVHLYIWIDAEDDVVACGAIARDLEHPEDSVLSEIFIAPKMQGKGLGRTIIETLEQDEYAHDATRLQIAASITECDFYQHMGYEYTEGKKQLNEEGLYQMEKFIL